jgi:ubiquitin-protein ligase
MISFSCEGCGKAYSLADHHGGRRATCRSSGAPLLFHAAGAVVVTMAPPPEVGPAPTATSNGPRQSVRTRRLLAEFQQMTEQFAHSSLIKLRSATGEPPDMYVIDYNVVGMARFDGRTPIVRNQHVVEIHLTSEYPRFSPRCRMLTPVFHPNIDLSTICVGDHWTAGERLVDLVVRIGEMLA